MIAAPSFQMFHGCLRHEKERENVCPECSFELLLGDFLNGVLRVLFGRVVYKDVQLAELLYCLGDRLSAKLLNADVAFD